MDEINAFALLEHSEIDPMGGAESNFLTFDAIISTRYVADGVAPDLAISDDEMDERYPVFAFQVDRNLVVRHIRSSDSEIDNTWYRISLGRSDGIARIYTDDRRREDRSWFIRKIEPAGEQMSLLLDNLVALPAVDDANQQAESVLRGCTSNAKHPLDVIVIDVGQGSMAALVHNEQSRPQLPIAFVDLGWPLNFNSESTPAHRPNISGTISPVVLTHWDWDHWGLAIESSRPKNERSPAWSIQWNISALMRYWIVPGCGVEWGGTKLKPIHWRLALALARRRNLIQWSSGVKSFSTNYISVHRAMGGPIGDMNQNGLAVVVSGIREAPALGSHRAILLPGDADYAWLPFLQENSNWPYRFCGLVASHHGANVNEAYIPRAKWPAWLAISAGMPNSYRHPKINAQKSYMNCGWRYQALTSNRVSFDCPYNKNCARGNILLTTRKLRGLRRDWPCCYWEWNGDQ